ncbi:MAG: hypothetical protein USCAAHI_01807 [Beijerinckiaceae bacterium]|nr:MAG: hypothetical protein USCAAHI_01807 [Beijerinckiaceae bacterium]
MSNDYVERLKSERQALKDAEQAALSLSCV